jgi:hypothetical protein
VKQFPARARGAGPVRTMEPRRGIGRMGKALCEVQARLAQSLIARTKSAECLGLVLGRNTLGVRLAQPFPQWRERMAKFQRPGINALRLRQDIVQLPGARQVSRMTTGGGKVLAGQNFARGHRLYVIGIRYMSCGTTRQSAVQFIRQWKS